MNLVLDTSASIPTSFVYGNNFWFSAPVLCDQLNAPVWISLSERIAKNMRADLLNSSSPVLLRPRMVYGQFSSPMQVDVKFHVNVRLEV